MNISGATGIAIGTGMANTNAIIAAQGPGAYAASLCRNYAGGGYHDWYLPSINELIEMYNLITALLMNRPYYWSSTHSTQNFAWCEYFNNLVGNYRDTYSKDTKMHVRAIRSF
jgi:hypothetical protein